MARLNSERYDQGVFLSLELTQAAVELDLTLQGKKTSYDHAIKIGKIIQRHYRETKKTQMLEYREDQALVSALVYDMIPETFGMTKENTKSYAVQDYLAGLELILEQFEEVEKADRQRLEFLRSFIVNLSLKRIGRLEVQRGHIALS